MFAQLVSTYHLHPIVDHFTIALLAFGIAAEILSAAAILLSRGRAGFLSASGLKLRSTSLLLMIAGAAASVMSYFTGDAEADRLWDTMSPVAQQILASSSGNHGYLSHAVLGQYLMYAFLTLAAWRVMLELSSRIERTRVYFLVVALVAAGALFYQGKTGGELVYEHGVGTPASHAQDSREPDSMRASLGPSPAGKTEWLVAVVRQDILRGWRDSAVRDS
jgi:uncharacterized membrane protein